MKAKDLRSENDPTIIPNDWILERVRNWRDAKLKDSDWTQLPDAPVDKEAWAEYRQALRDLPQSKANPAEIELPEVPA